MFQSRKQKLKNPELRNKDLNNLYYVGKSDFHDSEHVQALGVRIKSLFPVLTESRVYSLQSQTVVC